MFDANMKYLKKGWKFIASVDSLKENSLLKNFGIKRGDLLVCEMLDNKVSIHTRVKVSLPNGVDIIIKNYDSDGYYTRMTYSGNQSGSGFICDNIKARAITLMEKVL